MRPASGWQPDRTFDVIVLDRMLPDLEGTEVLRILRSRGVATPVLMLTALGSVEHRVGGLNAGADDYLTKPFAFAELLARIRALADGPSRPEPRARDRRRPGPGRGTAHGPRR